MQAGGKTRVVILCGGQGTRLREHTEYVPKPLVQIGDQPILWHIMKHFQKHAFTSFVLCLGYKGDKIKSYILDYGAMSRDFTVSLGRPESAVFHSPIAEEDLEVTLAETGSDAMTGSRVKRVARYLSDGPFMVTYGDGVSDVDVTALLAFHRSHGKLATVTAVMPESRFGVIETDEGGRAVRFREKPQTDGLVNAGFFVFEPAVLDYLSVDPSCILEREPLERLARDGQLMVFRHDGFFHTLDTYRDYLALNALWAEGRAPWRSW
ncbi:MAG: glucose-1-phosphate cytidylyltransferase [Alphaproteobacteria bacterium]|nr:glucose-1-phosphate cytidylyltransferase [Alphaproteobacteria bacterium]